MPDNILTAREVSDWLKINIETLYKLAKKGEFPAIKIGGQWRFSQTHVQQWLDEQSGVQGSRAYGNEK